MLDLVALFDSLHPPSAATSEVARFSAHPVPEHEQHRIAKDTLGAPSLLVAIADLSGDVRPNPILLENLSVQHDVRCHIYPIGGAPEDGSFTVIRCVGADRDLHVYFLRAISAVVSSLGARPTRQDVAHAVDKFVELFRAMANPPRKSIQGLWAELFLIARSSDPAMLITAWHLTPEDRFDFSHESQRIEVKSASGRRRHHHFALEQLHPPAGTSLLIASLFVERSAAGISVAELVDRIRTRVGSVPNHLMQLDRVVGLTLGDRWRSAFDEKFDLGSAEESLAFFEPSIVPSVNPDLPPGVSEVRFKSDLTGKPTAKLLQYRARGGLFRAALR